MSVEEKQVEKTHQYATYGTNLVAKTFLNRNNYQIFQRLTSLPYCVNNRKVTPRERREKEHIT